MRGRSPATKIATKRTQRVALLAPDETPTKEHHQKMVDADPTVAQSSTITLSESYEDFEAKGSAHHEKYYAEMVATLAKHLNIDAARIEIAGHEKGSLKLHVVVKPGTSKGAKTVADVKKSLETQMADKESGLRKEKKLAKFAGFVRHTLADSGALLVDTRKTLGSVKAEFAAAKLAWATERTALVSNHRENVELATGPLERELVRMGEARDHQDKAFIEMETRLRAQVGCVFCCASLLRVAFLSSPPPPHACA